MANNMSPQTTNAPSEAPTDPWATSTVDASGDTSTMAADPWGSVGDAGQVESSSFMSAGQTDEAFSFSLSDPFQQPWLPLDNWVDSFVTCLVSNFRPVFSAIKAPVDTILTAIDGAFNAMPPLLMILLMGLIAWQLSGKRMGIAAAAGMLLLGAIGAWAESMTTLALVTTSVFFCILIGIPGGIAMARSKRAAQIIRPILDMMQTTPAFVYLVPIVMLFGIGNVPGVVVTIIFALAPVIRLTHLGISKVPDDLIEAARSFGTTPRQLLFKVQLPLAMPTIMAGVNQTLMLSLSMVVIASMISVGGLGLMVLRGIGRLDIGLATIGGLGIVVLAIILDRMTQSLGKDARERGSRHWYQTGPVGLLMKFKSK